MQVTGMAGTAGHRRHFDERSGQRPFAATGPAKNSHQVMGAPPPALLGGFRIVGGIVLTFCGVATLSVNAYGWAALFLVPAALNLAFGYWEITIARSASA
jgi:hypothetical protein